MMVDGIESNGMVALSYVYDRIHRRTQIEFTVSKTCLTGFSFHFSISASLCLFISVVKSVGLSRPSRRVGSMQSSGTLFSSRVATFFY